MKGKNLLRMEAGRMLPVNCQDFIRDWSNGRLRSFVMRIHRYGLRRPAALLRETRPVRKRRLTYFRFYQRMDLSMENLIWVQILCLQSIIIRWTIMISQLRRKHSIHLKNILMRIVSRQKSIKRLTVIRISRHRTGWRCIEITIWSLLDLAIRMVVSIYQTITEKLISLNSISVRVRACYLHTIWPQCTILEVMTLVTLPIPICVIRWVWIVIRLSAEISQNVSGRSWQKNRIMPMTVSRTSLVRSWIRSRDLHTMPWSDLAGKILIRERIGIFWKIRRCRINIWSRLRIGRRVFVESVTSQVIPVLIITMILLQRSVRWIRDRLHSIRSKLIRCLRFRRRMDSGISWTWKIRRLRYGTVLLMIRELLHGRGRIIMVREPVQPTVFHRMMLQIIIISTVREMFFIPE